MAKQQSDSSFEGMVAVFELLLTFLTYLGAGYNPVPAHLKLPALQGPAGEFEDVATTVVCGTQATYLPFRSVCHRPG